MNLRVQGCGGLELYSFRVHTFATLSLNIAQKPHIVWSLGPKASKYEASEPWLNRHEGFQVRSGVRTCTSESHGDPPQQVG